MKFTVRYIPVSKIKPDFSLKITDRIKGLQRLMWDCMHVMVVRKNRKDGSYSIVSGSERLDYIKKYTNKIYAPCIIDDNGMKSWINRLCKKQPLDDFPMAPASWTIVRSFLKKEPRFKKLSRIQQLVVLFLGVRYKKTVISSMKNRVSDMLQSNH
jgi:hypothetical protein